MNKTQIIKYHRLIITLKSIKEILYNIDDTKFITQNINEIYITTKTYNILIKQHKNKYKLFLQQPSKSIEFIFNTNKQVIKFIELCFKSNTNINNLNN